MKRKYIEELLERFFEGKTTNKEEQELYTFFNSNEIPEHLKQYKDIFEYFETGIIQEFKDKEKKLPVKKRISGKGWGAIISIAATLLILLMINTFNDNYKTEFNPYEGSYIIRNGEKITDLDAIMPELEKTIIKTKNLEREMDKILANTMYIEDYPDPLEHIYTQFEELMDVIQDEELQRELSDIFEIENN